MLSYIVPIYLNHNIWVNNRKHLWQLLEIEDDIEINFGECEWIDLIGLADILLFIKIRLNKSVSFSILLNLGVTTGESHLKVLKFLNISGFVESVNEIESGSKIGYALDGIYYKASDYKLDLDNIRSTLNQVFITKCKIIDVNKLKTRGSVYTECRKMCKEDLLNEERFFIKIPYDLLQEAKVFYNTVLPEIIDNVRLHKTDSAAKYLSLIIRMRKREQLALGPPRHEGIRLNRTRYERITDSLWQTDIIEAVACDYGDSIQKSFISNHEIKYQSGANTIIKDKYGVNISGHNGNYELIKNIFEKPMSSLTPDERKKEGLTSISGLYAIKNCMEGSEWHISIRSGENNIVVSSVQLEEDTKQELKKVQVKPDINVDDTPGVQFIFRISSHQGFPLDKWVNVAIKKNIQFEDTFWITNYPPKYANIHCVDNYSIPSIIKNGDIIICRPKDSINKYDLRKYISDVKRKKVKLCFADVPASIAIKLYLMIKMDWDNYNILCPIITETFQLNIPYKSNNSFEHIGMLNSFITKDDKSNKYWWSNKSSPVNDISDIFNKCRENDSRLFWDYINKTNQLYSTEYIEWGENIVLTGGYLSFSSALSNKIIRNIFERRLIVNIHALNGGHVLPTSNILRNLVSRIVNHSNLNRNELTSTVNNILVSSVEVTGETNIELNKDAILTLKQIALPIFVYPQKHIKSFQASDNENLLRVLDWKDVPPVNIEFLELKRIAKLTRIGSTGRVRIKPKGSLVFNSEEKPFDAFVKYQQMQMIEIGHYSHQRHHFYIWINLIPFLGGKTPERDEIINIIRDKIINLEIKTLFFAQNEITELLVELVKNSLEKQNYKIDSDRIFPLTMVTDYIHSSTNSNNCPEFVKPLESKKVMFLDDINVTGRTIRIAYDSLRSIGYEDIFSITLINMNPDSVGKPNDVTKYSIWNLQIKPSGSDGGCIICSGINNIETLINGNNSKILKDILKLWIEHWKKEDILHRYENRLEKQFVNDPIPKVYGFDIENNILQLASSDAMALWYFDMASRLEHYGYIFDDKDRKMKEAYTEIYSGLVFLYWKELGQNIKKKTLRGLLNKIYDEERESGKALLTICISSLPKKDKTYLLNIFENKISVELFNTYQTFMFYFLLLKMNENEENNIEKRISHLSQIVEIRAKQYDIEKLRMFRSFVLLSEYYSSNVKNDIKLVLNLIGYPGQAIAHNRIGSLLLTNSTIRKSIDEVIEIIHELIPLLEPIRDLINHRVSLFSDFAIYDQINEIFKKLDELIAEKHNLELVNNLIYPKDKDPLLSTLHRLLFIEGITNNSNGIRRIIWWEYLHNVAFTISYTIYELMQTIEIDYSDIKFDSDKDFYINDQHRSIITSLDYCSNRKDIIELEDQYLDSCMLLFDHRYLMGIIRDLLTDIKHPKKMNLKYEDNSYIKISLKLETNDSGQYKQIIEFCNRSNPGVIDLIHKKKHTWKNICEIISKHGGDTKLYEQNGEIKKVLILPAIFVGRK